MKLLLDTHLLLWASGQTDRLSEAARSLLEDIDNELIFSSASIWEVAIKSKLGRSDFSVDARLLRRGLLDNGYLELPIASEHTAHTTSLADIHNDPIDRILIAQSLLEGITLLTSDALVAEYAGPIRLV